MKFAALAFAAIGVLAVGSLFFVVLIPGFLCENTLVEEVYSPNGEMKAVVFQRKCSSSTDSSTQVSISTADAQLPGGVGNVFVARTNIHAEQRLPSPVVKLRWTHDTFLEVSHSEDDRIFKSERMINGIEVGYHYPQSQKGKGV